MQRVAEKQLDDDLFFSDLRGEAAQSNFVGSGRRPNFELFAEFVGELTFQPDNHRVVHAERLLAAAESIAEFVGWQTLHSDEQPTAMSIAPGPVFDLLVDLLPAAQIEISDAEITPLTERERLTQGREQRLLDIVEDSGHRGSLVVETDGERVSREYGGAAHVTSDCDIVTAAGAARELPVPISAGALADFADAALLVSFVFSGEDFLTIVPFSNKNTTQPMTLDKSTHVAVVTGGARGIGLRIAEWFLAAGYRVALFDIDVEMLPRSERTLNDPSELVTLNETEAG